MSKQSFFRAFRDSSGNVQRGASVEIFITGTETYATVYDDVDGNTIGSQPLTTDGFGEIQTYLDPGVFDYRITTSTTERTINAVTIVDPAVGVLAAAQAAASAEAADDSATAAAASEAAAATSETNAGISETNAAASAAAAAASETAAATSEANAATSETNAAASETNAAASETSAAASATEAASYSDIAAIRLNTDTVEENLIVDDGFNGLSAGPITIEPPNTVTVEPGQHWSIV